MYSGLKIENVSAGYGSEEILHNVSLSVKEGEFLSLLGANGEGKTTLLKVLCGLKKSKTGKVYINGKAVGEISPKRLAEIVAYVPQNHQPGMAFTVLDMTLFGCIHRQKAFSNPRRRDYDSAFQSLKELGIEHLASKNYTALSGGEQRLVLLARALTQNARFIVLDEPVSNLDLGNQIRVLQVLHKFSLKGIGVIMTSHFPEHCLWLNTRTAILHEGEIVADDFASEVITGSRLSTIYSTEICVKNNNGISYCEPRFIQELAK
jgi:iron complex transport system ATP-binding protein